MADPRALLAGRTIIITGAGRGIGEGMALDAAMRGANVVLNDLEVDRIEAVADKIIRQGGTAELYAGSIAEWEVAEGLVSFAIDTFGRLDGLINNAGIHYQADPWDETERRVRTAVEVNVLGTMYCGIHALKQMRAQENGTIVNVTSGALMGADQRSIYGATKGAVASLTLGWAHDMAPHNVRVNAIAPLAATRMTLPDLEPGDPGGAGTSTFHQMATPAQLGMLSSWLLSDASAAMTGKIVRFNGAELSQLSIDTHEQDMTSQPDWTLPQMEAACLEMCTPCPSPN